MSPRRHNRTTLSELTIIGGSHRRRKWQFPLNEGLRPTPNRLRETLFNWVAPSIEKCSCLDLFAGSGALGFEALSRGARHVTLVDNEASTVSYLRHALDKFQFNHTDIVQADALAWLQTPARHPYQLIFLDPPFHKGLTQPAVDLIEGNHWLTTDGQIYIEMAKQEPLPELPGHWHLNKEKTAGDVRCLLLDNHNRT